MSNRIKVGTISTVLFALLILFLSIMPSDFGGSASPIFFRGIDKIVHGLMYAIFTVLLLNEYPRKFPAPPISYVLILLGIWGYSLIMELIQLYFVEYRSAEWFDALANLVGIITGAGIILSIKKFKS